MSPEAKFRCPYCGGFTRTAADLTRHLPRCPRSPTRAPSPLEGRLHV